MVVGGEPDGAGFSVLGDEVAVGGGFVGVGDECGVGLVGFGQVNLSVPEEEFGAGGVFEFHSQTVGFVGHRVADAGEEFNECCSILVVPGGCRAVSIGGFDQMLIPVEVECVGRGSSAV